MKMLLSCAGLIAALTLAAAALRGADADTPTAATTQDSVAAAYSQSYELEAQKNYPDAIKALQRVPQGYMLEMRLGTLSYLAGDNATAEIHFLVAISKSPNSLEAKLALLQPLQAEKKYADMEKRAMQVVHADPDSYYGNLRLLYALRGEAKYEQAEPIANHMVALYPSDTAFICELAWAKMGLKQLEAAKQLLNQVLLLDPNDALAKEEIAKL